MSSNPYQAPLTDVTPPEARARRWAWVKDRLTLLGVAIGMALLIGAVLAIAVTLNWPVRGSGYVFYAVAIAVALLHSYGRLRLHWKK